MLFQSLYRYLTVIHHQIQTLAVLIQTLVVLIQTLAVLIQTVETDDAAEVSL